MTALLNYPIAERVWHAKASERDGNVLSASTQAMADAGSWEPVIKKIVEFQQLKENWDQAGAEPPSRDVLESAIGLSYCLLEKGVDPPHRVAPGVAGEVVLEWQ